MPNTIQIPKDFIQRNEQVDEILLSQVPSNAHQKIVTTYIIIYCYIIGFRAGIQERDLGIRVEKFKTF